MTTPAFIQLKEQQNFWKSSNETFLTHPPYSPDLVPSDFYLFPYMKRWLAYQRFASDEELQNAVTGTILRDVFLSVLPKAALMAGGTRFNPITTN
ncbi:hypothetical protein J6590_018048 [Homalodisca vitripennis]|nr:hypothetical protein J6590_018048 [Homalodisca vitripennis]